MLITYLGLNVEVLCVCVCMCACDMFCKLFVLFCFLRNEERGRKEEWKKGKERDLKIVFTKQIKNKSLILEGGGKKIEPHELSSPTSQPRLAGFLHGNTIDYFFF